MTCKQEEKVGHSSRVSLKNFLLNSIFENGASEGIILAVSFPATSTVNSIQKFSTSQNNEIKNKCSETIRLAWEDEEELV